MTLCRLMRVLPFTRPFSNPTLLAGNNNRSLVRSIYGASILSLLFLNTSCIQELDANAFSLSPVTENEQPVTVQDSTDSVQVVTQEALPPAEEETLSATTSSLPEVHYPGPEPLPGAILPGKRIIAFYGNLLSKRMGILGELEPEIMLAKLDEEVAYWTKADSLTPVQPALHAIVVTAQGHPSAGGKYRLRMKHKMIEDVLELANKRNAIVFLDVQVGHSTLQEELPQLEKYLILPNVHLGIDAEFSMKDGNIPGRSIGTFDAEDINYASGYLASLVKENQIPPKLLIVHRFTQRMITNYQDIELRPETQVVMHMDGWGSPALKKDTYRRYIQKEPVQFTGFKLFYKNDLKNSSRLMTPEEIISLNPSPLYIQYQ